MTIDVSVSGTTVSATVSGAVETHGSTHAAAGTDPVTISQSQVSGLTAALAQVPTGTGITAIVAISQAAYDALPTKSATTLYVIT